ncbi:MAG: class I SAM-dependent methyltransferase [Bacteroidia bacterium]|nr:class I SAM-dependent methyltransferase [Bacteroidia bacterium]MBT8268455.1 class I SAM-dependent methyltransferase [Bacteroidia bacterium]NNF82100.1 class I SAM-dependent methyltransferase [Flavobacteriaceae bacterium]NNK70436.1 class I SAM-dependent methyltransferase [Flavobacteriaceae bacterium]NNL81582.1 class I SAM-dependent methyltransferase [Flavobacteriaceae bacterium]
MQEQTPFLKLKDHAVSGENFELHLNEEYHWLETRPRPEQSEMDRYYESEDYISHTDARRNWFEKLYHRVKAINLNRKIKLIESQDSDSKRLLDIGCGTGDFLHLAKTNGWAVSGIEPNEQARSIASSKNGPVIFDPAEWKNREEDLYDVITLWHVLEHLPDPSKAIQDYFKILSEEGSLIIAVPNFRSFDASYYKSNWAGYDVPRHLWHFSRDSIEILAEQNNFKLKSVHPMKFDAYYVSLLSEKYKSGWMNIFNAFFVASRSNLKASRSGEYSSLIYVLRKV